MALIVETGAIIANSDSYVTRAEHIAYALSLGVVVADTTATDAKLRKAALFIASKESRLRGGKVSRDQSMAFPRSGLVIEGFTWDEDEIPTQAKKCQMELALDIEAGVDPFNPPQSASAGVKSKRVEGAVEIVYAVSDAMGGSRKSLSSSLLTSLLKGGGLLWSRG